MSVFDTTEKRFESDIEAFFVSAEGGYTKTIDTYDPKLGLYVGTLISFIQRSQPKAWQRFANMNAVDPEKKFCLAFNNACDKDRFRLPVPNPQKAPDPFGSGALSVKSEK